MDNPVQIKLEQQQDFQFAVHFDNPLIPVLLTDEPAPLGGGQGKSLRFRWPTVCLRAFCLPCGNLRMTRRRFALWQRLERGEMRKIVSV